MNKSKLESFIREFILKEPLSCLTHAYYRIRGVFHLPVKQAEPYPVQTTGKALLLLHGSGACPSSLIPLFNALADISPLSIHLIDLSKESSSIPTKPIHDAMRRIKREFQNRGFSNVEFSFIGHSLGAIAAAKAIWLEGCSRWGKIHALTSLAGRLKFVSGPFDWFCEELIPEIEEIHAAYKERPELAKLYTIAGELDELVPLSSVHIARSKGARLTVQGVGHGGLPFAKEVHSQIRKWLKPWAFSST